jgi:hypothetical protein
MVVGMIGRAAFVRAGLVGACATFLALGAAPLNAAKFYVDARLGDVKQEDVIKVADPQPAQVLVEFQTDGVANAKATKYIKPLVTSAITERHIFSEISEQPVANRTILTVVYNNIPEKGAAGKGAKVGLTFGLASASVTDSYKIHFELLRGPGTTPMTCDVEHAFIMTMGKKEDPAIGIPVAKIDLGMQMIVNQVMAHGLNCLTGKMASGAAPAGQ